MLSQTLKQLRKSIISERKAIDPAYSSSCALEIKNTVTRLRCYHQAKKIALYISHGGEVETSLILNDALARGKQVYLPILHNNRGASLLFAPYDQNTQLKLNRYNIPEPDVASCKLIKPRNLDMVITPLVAFDHNCERIGMGGGYYDRSFAFINHLKQWQHPKLTGVAYEFQKINDCEPSSWDIPLHYVVTENCLYSK